MKWRSVLKETPEYDIPLETKGGTVFGKIIVDIFSSKTGDWTMQEGDPTHFRNLKKDNATRYLFTKPVASGAGFGFCPCGWKSKVADDGGDYQWSDIQRDFQSHICNS